MKRIPNDRSGGYKPKRDVIQPPLRFKKQSKDTLSTEQPNDHIPETGRTNLGETVSSSDFKLFPDSKVTLKQAVDIIEEQCSINNLSQEKRYLEEYINHREGLYHAINELLPIGAEITKSEIPTNYKKQNFRFYLNLRDDYLKTAYCRLCIKEKMKEPHNCSLHQGYSVQRKFQSIIADLLSSK